MLSQPFSVQCVLVIALCMQLEQGSAARLNMHSIWHVAHCLNRLPAEALRQARDNLRLRCPQLPDTSVTLLEADYLAGVAEVRRQHPDAMLFLLWLGSSVGNFGQDAAAGFLHDLASMAGEHSQLLLCCDMWKDVGTLQAAYNDAQGGPAWLLVAEGCRGVGLCRLKM